MIAQNVEESLGDPQLAGHPSTWSIEQVGHWLRICGFGAVAGSFVGKFISCWNYIESTNTLMS